jgi:hypothetical protein
MFVSLFLKQYVKNGNMQVVKFKKAKNAAVKVANKNDRFDEQLGESNVLLYERMHVFNDISK